MTKTKAIDELHFNDKETMRAKYIITALSMLAVLSSCSKTGTESQSTAPDAWIQDETLPVPVNFTNMDFIVTSKAQVTDIGQMKSVGVYGVCNGESSTWADETGDDVLICNTEAKVSAAGDLTFTPVVYYPMSSDKDFTFYGYYPYSADAAYDSESGKYTVTYDISNGDTDIIWAKSAAKQFSSEGIDYTGFNARYIRAVKKLSDPASVGNPPEPHFTFDHLLTALTFRTKRPEASSVGIYVKKIELLEVPTAITLQIADKNGENEGSITASGSTSVTLKKPNTSDDVYSNVPTAEPQALPGVLLVPPQDSYKANVYIAVGTGDATPVPIEVMIERDGGFEKGNQYTLTLSIVNPEKVEVSSELTPWEIVEEDTEITVG